MVERNDEALEIACQVVAEFLREARAMTEETHNTRARELARWLKHSGIKQEVSTLVRTSCP